MLDQYALLNKIRRRVFEEVAKLAYEGGDYTRIEGLPYTEEENIKNEVFTSNYNKIKSLWKSESEYCQETPGYIQCTNDKHYSQTDNQVRVEISNFSDINDSCWIDYDYGNMKCND